MIQTGLIGWPLGHSFSPAIHNLAFEIAGLKGNYSLFPVDPADRSGLASAIADLRQGQTLGLNVTIPHKVTMFNLVDDLTPIARRIGAVNTLVMKGGRLIGTNTDSPGFSHDLARKFGEEIFSCGKALVFGAGGSARAVVLALLDKGIGVTVAARDIRKAERELNGSDHAGSIAFVDLHQLSDTTLDDHQLFINTTPLGMFPSVDSSPLPPGLELPASGFVYDLVYNPANTFFYRQAVAKGCKAATGFGMLVEQALIAFEIWTGIAIDRDEFYRRYNTMEENK